MSEGVFVDSGAFVGFLVRSNPDHGALVRLFSSPPLRMYTSVLVIAETYDWLRRLTSEGAGAFTQLLRRLPDLEILTADFSHASAVQRKLSAYPDTDLSYLGASSLVFLGQHQILDVWGADPILGLEGARVLP